MKLHKALACFALVSLSIAVCPADDALTHFLRGEDLHRQGQYGQAIEEFKQALALDEKLKGAHFYLGLAYGQTNRKAEAVEQFAKFVAVANLNIPGERQLCIESLKEMIQLQFQLGSYGDAYTNARKFVELAGSSAYLSPPFTEIAAKAGHIDEVIADAEKAVQVSPKNPQVYRDLIAAYQSGGRNEEVFKLLQTAVKSCPEVLEFHQSLAMQYGNRRDWNNAEKEYRAAIAILPDSYWPYQSLASMLLELGKNKEALETAEKALELAKKGGLGDPYITAIEQVRDRARAKLLTPEQLLQEYARKAKASPQDAAAHRAYADALETAGQYDKAIDEHIAAVKLDGVWGKLTEFGFRLRAQARLQEVAHLLMETVSVSGTRDEGNRSNAIQEFLTGLRSRQFDSGTIADLDARLKQTPNVAGLHQLRSQVYEEIEKNLPAAIQELSRVSELAPKQIDTLIHLGDLLTQAGRREEALAVFQKAKVLDATNSVALERIGDTLRDSGRLEEALESYEGASARPMSGEQSNKLWGKMNELYRKLGRTDALRVRLEGKVKDDPNSPTPLIALGEFLWQQGDRAGALKTLDKAMELAGPYAVVHLQVSQFYLSNADEEHAEAALIAGMKAAPKDFNIHREAYEFYQKRNRIDRALEICKVLCDTDMPWSRGGWDEQLLRCFLAAGKAKEAARYYEERVKKDPTDKSAREMLPKARMAAGLLPGEGSGASGATPKANPVKLWISDTTILTAVENPIKPDFKVTRQRDFQLLIWPTIAANGFAKIMGLRMGETYPPAQVQADEQAGSIATWDVASLPAGDSGLRSVSARTPAVTGACDIEGLLVDRQVEPLGGNRYKCTVKVRCPFPVIVKVLADLMRNNGTEIEENSFDPPAESFSNKPLDCRSERIFKFSFHTNIKQYLPFVELRQSVTSQPKEIKKTEQGLSVQFNGVTTTLTGATDVLPENVTLVTEWRLVVPEQTGGQ